ncbi:MAG: hypothetical protein IJD67_06800, partial [Clostridia bacterium]|nr:hypothetical protein [Clostridia bacterium]
DTTAESESVIEEDTAENISEAESEETEQITEAQTSEIVTEAVTLVPEKAVEIVGEDVAKEADKVGVLGGADDLLDGVTDIIYSELDEAEKQAFVESAKEEGLEVVFNDDGTTTIIYEDGTRATQKADGTFVIENDGYAGQIGGEWPENDRTKLIPKPEKGTVLTSDLRDGTAKIMLGECSIEDAVAYASKLIEKGFDSNVKSDDTMLAEGVFSYRGENTKKKAVATVNYISDMMMITVSK